MVKHTQTIWQYIIQELRIKPQIFKLVYKKFGRPESDLFAAHLSTKCESYLSPKPMPNTFEVDVCIINWNYIKGCVVFSPIFINWKYFDQDLPASVSMKVI